MLSQGQAHADVSTSKQQANAILLGQLLGMIDSCNPSDTNILGEISLVASKMLSPSDSEHNALILFSFAAGATAQTKLFLNGKSEITCEQAVELAKSMQKK